MGTLLKVLTVIILLLSIGAFILGLANFNKRELLVGRTQALELKISQIALTIEEDDPPVDDMIEHVEQDISEVTARQNDIVDTSDFWSSYKDELEKTGMKRFNLSTDAMKDQLRTYYKMGTDGKPEKDVQGRPRTTGTGTMDALLTRLLERAQKQLTTLNNTRTQLVDVREELENVITELNREKKERRANLATINSQQDTIGRLEGDVAERDRQIAQLNREKSSLEDEVVSLKGEIADRDEKLRQMDTRVKQLESELDRIKGPLAGGSEGPKQTGTAPDMTAGTKGTVVRVDSELAIVLVELTEEAVTELLGPNGTDRNFPVELMVYRDSPSKMIVTRVRLNNVTTTADGKKLGIAHNMYGWEQVPVKVGDYVVY